MALIPTYLAKKKREARAIIKQNPNTTAQELQEQTGVNKTLAKTFIQTEKTKREGGGRAYYSGYAKTDQGLVKVSPNDPAPAHSRTVSTKTQTEFLKENLARQGIEATETKEGGLKWKRDGKQHSFIAGQHASAPEGAVIDQSFLRTTERRRVRNFNRGTVQPTPKVISTTDARTRTPFERRVEKLERGEAKIGERYQKYEAFVGKYSTAKGDSFFNTARRKLGANILYVPEGLVRTAHVTGGKLSAIGEGFYKNRKGTVKELKRAGKETPKTVARGYDPRTPTGIANIGTTGLIIAGGLATKGARAKYTAKNLAKSKPPKSEFTASFGQKNVKIDVKSPAIKTTGGYSVKAPPSMLGQKATTSYYQIRAPVSHSKPTVTVFKGANKQSSFFAVNVKGTQYTTQQKGSFVFRSVTKPDGATVTKVFKGDKLFKTIKSKSKAQTLTTESKQLAKADIGASKPFRTFEGSRTLERAKLVSDFKGKYQARGKLYKKTTERLDAVTVSPRKTTSGKFIDRGGKFIKQKENIQIETYSHKFVNKAKREQFIFENKANRFIDRTPDVSAIKQDVTVVGKGKIEFFKPKPEPRIQRPTPSPFKVTKKIFTTKKAQASTQIIKGKQQEIQRPPKSIAGKTQIKIYNPLESAKISTPKPLAFSVTPTTQQPKTFTSSVGKPKSIIKPIDKQTYTPKTETRYNFKSSFSLKPASASKPIQENIPALKPASKSKLEQKPQLLPKQQAKQQTKQQAKQTITPRITTGGRGLFQFNPPPFTPLFTKIDFKPKRSPFYKKPRSSKKLSQLRRFSPTARAISFGIKGNTPPSSVKTGLGARFIPLKPPKRKYKGFKL